MPPKSQAQARFLRAVASGQATVPNLTRKQAQEIVAGHSTKHLPERVKQHKEKPK